MASENNKFTTGLLAQVWRVKGSTASREKDVQVNLVQIEYRIERARNMLQRIEERAERALEEVERAERRFETLKDSFTSLQQEWKIWKQQKDQE